jgi:hypothetical protein
VDLGEKKMIKYYCDLCEKECHNDKVFTLPVAATFVGKEPHDLMPLGMHLCIECRRKIYKAIETIVPEDKIKNYNAIALDVKMYGKTF